MKLNAIKFGLTLGIVWSGAVLCLALMGSFLGWGAGLVKAIGTLYLGYGMTPSGVLIGMLWAFVDVGVGGWIVAVIYNKLVG